jgi:hypothetical protein
MTLALALNGVQVMVASICIPYYGTWSGDLALTTPQPEPSTPGGCSVVLGNLTLTGTAFRAANFAGCRTSRLVGGYGGWRTPVTPRTYKNVSGISLSMVLGDLATEVGEQIAVATDSVIGSFYLRATPGKPPLGADVLRQLSGGLWWVDSSGKTQVGPRPQAAITSPFLIDSWHGAQGAFEVATEDPASWVPGNTFSCDTVTTTQTISMVTILAENSGKVRIRVLSTGETIGP